MSLSTKVDYDTSLDNRGVLFKAFRDLLKQREVLDQELLKLQSKMLRIVERRSPDPDSATSKKYVPRMQNHTILAEAIRECMIPGQKMGMQEILSALEKTGSYKTRSSYFYTMVNNKLNKDPYVKKVSRGVFVLKKRLKKKTVQVYV